MNAQFSPDIKVVSIFLKPSNLDVLKERLFRRGSDSKENIEKRLETAKESLNLPKNLIMSSFQQKRTLITRW